MALLKPSPALPPADNYLRIGRAFDAIDAVTDLAATLNSSVSQQALTLASHTSTLDAHGSSIQDLLAAEIATSGRLDSISGQLSAAEASLSNRIAQEEEVRDTADAALQALTTQLQRNVATEVSDRIAAQAAIQVFIEALQRDLTQSINDRIAAFEILQDFVTTVQADLATEVNGRIANTSAINTYIRSVQRDLATEVDGRIAAFNALQDFLEAVQADLTAQLSAEVSNRTKAVAAAAADAAAGLAGEVDTRRAAVAALTARVVAQRVEFTQPIHRPGLNPIAFGLVDRVERVGGARLALPLVPDANVVAGDRGPVVRLTGTAVLATRTAVPIELGRLVRVRGAVQRRVSPADPAGDAVVIAVAWLDQSLTLLPAGSTYTVLKRFDRLEVGIGRQEIAAYVAQAPVPNLATIQPPAAARYFVPCVLSYGPDGGTDIDVLGHEDVTAATILDPVSADVAAQVAGLMSLDLGPRMAAAESALAGATSVTFPTRGEAVAATVPASVTTIRLLGRDSAGDGRDGLYKRIPGPLTPGEDGFTLTAGGVFRRVTAAQDVFNATFGPLFVRYLATLPAAAPDLGGAWMNAGGLTLAPVPAQ